MTIEPITAPAFEVVATWLSDPEINRWLSSEWRGRSVTPTVIAMAVRNSKIIYLVRRFGRQCGLTALADIDLCDRTAMVWYFLAAKDLSGLGIVSAGVRAMVGAAFHELRLESLYAWVMEDNLGSIAVLRAVGFQQAGRIRRATNSAGHQVDRIYFDLLASKYA